MIKTERNKPSQSRSRERVIKILDAAAIVLVKQGYDGTTLREVAKQAGVKQTSLYRYWPNKQAIVSDLVGRFIVAQDRELDECVKLRKDGASAQEALAEFVSRLRIGVESEKWIRPCQIALISDPALQSTDAAMHHHFANRFGTIFFEDSENNVEDRAISSRMLVIFLDTFIMSLNRYATVDHQTMEEEFLRLFTKLTA